VPTCEKVKKSVDVNKNHNSHRKINDKNAQNYFYSYNIDNTIPLFTKFLLFVDRVKKFSTLKNCGFGGKLPIRI
jgi:hypothetical protein